MLSLTYVLSCAVIIVCMMSANLVSEAPDNWVAHIKRFERLIVMFGAITGVAKAMGDGWVPGIPNIILILGVAIVSVTTVCEKVDTVKKREQAGVGRERRSRPCSG